MISKDYSFGEGDLRSLLEATGPDIHPSTPRESEEVTINIMMSLSTQQQPTEVASYLSAHEIGQDERLLPMSSLTRPANFGTVAPGIFRSSYPQPNDWPFLKSLGIKTIITLVDKEPPTGFEDFMASNSIQQRLFAMAGTKKEGIDISMMRDIIGQITDQRNHPVLIHCNQGKHRTGCVVGVLRKVHGWDLNAVLAEYRHYANPKERETDVEYLSDFKLEKLRRVNGLFAIGFLVLSVTIFLLLIWYICY